MSIRDAAMQLAKAVKAAEGRERIRGLLRELNTSRDGVPSRAQFGYSASRLNGQLHGYLLLDQVVSASRATGGTEPALLAEERQLLGRAHQQIVSMNQKCIQLIVEVLPEIKQLLDPYNRFKPVEVGDGAGEPILPESAFAPVVAAFAHHPAIEKFLQGNCKLLPGTSEHWYFQAARGLESEILAAGPLDSPKRIATILDSRSAKDAETILLRQLACILSIRASLETIDQVVYQALLHDKLPALTIDNVIDVGCLAFHYMGQGAEIVYQPTPPAFHVNPIDVIVVEDLPAYDRIAGLYRVEVITHHPTHEYGFMDEAVMRRLDEHLNPYTGLLHLV